MNRYIKNLISTPLAVRRAFSRETLEHIEKMISETEQQHSGEIVFAVEGALPLRALLRKSTARQRAMDVFSRLRVWDTEENCGVLIYVLVAERKIEIIADRGINSKIADSTWQEVCSKLSGSFAAGDFSEGASKAIGTIGSLLAAHFPAKPGDKNELDNRPVFV